MKKREKVFCKDCKYKDGDMCNRYHYIEEDYVYGHRQRRASCYSGNSDGNCKGFEPHGRKQV